MDAAKAKIQTPGSWKSPQIHTPDVYKYKDKADIAYLKVQEALKHEYGYPAQDQSFLDFMQNVMNEKLNLDWYQVEYIGTLLELERHTYETASGMEMPQDINLTDVQMRCLTSLPGLIWVHHQLMNFAEFNDVESLVKLGLYLTEPHNRLTLNIKT